MYISLLWHSSRWFFPDRICTRKRFMQTCIFVQVISLPVVRAFWTAWFYACYAWFAIAGIFGKNVTDEGSWRRPPLGKSLQTQMYRCARGRDYWVVMAVNV